MIGSLLKSGLHISFHLFKSALGQKIIKDWIKQMSNKNKAGVIKILNKKFKKGLKSEQKKLKINFITGKMLKGISNFQIDNTINKIDDEDLNNNFVGSISSRQNEEIYRLQTNNTQNNCKISFFNSWHRRLKQGWWALMEHFFFDSFGVEGLKEFIITDEEKQSNK